MKLSLSSLFFLLAVNANASIYSTNFSSLGTPGSDVNGQGGWSINDTTDQFSLVATWNSSKAIGLGDASAVTSLPVGSTVSLSHGIAAAVGETTVGLEFAIFDSYNDSGKLNRDEFGISLSNGGSPVLSIWFEPENPTPTDPDDNSENDGDGAKWIAKYQVGAGPTISLGMAIFEGSEYLFDLELTPNVNPLLTDLSLTLSGGTSMNSTATALAIDSTGGFDAFNLSWSKVGTNPYGSNIILMDNLTVVPEPSSTLLLGIAGLGLALRRRRA